MIRWFKSRMSKWFRSKDYYEGMVVTEFGHLEDAYRCLEFLREGRIDEAIETLEDRIDHLVFCLSCDIPRIKPSTKDLAVEMLKRTYEYREKYAGGHRPHTPISDAELEKHYAETKVKAAKYLQHVWDNEPGNPRYRRKTEGSAPNGNAAASA